MKASIRKEFCANSERPGGVCVLTTSTYQHDIAYIHALFGAAKADFPHLQPGAVRIEKYSGNRRKGMFGIEFDVDDADKVPAAYVRIASTEFVAS